MNVHASFIHNAPNWKEPICPSTGEGINKIRTICRVEYSVIKRNKLLRHVTTYKSRRVKETSYKRVYVVLGFGTKTQTDKPTAKSTGVPQRHCGFSSTPPQ